MAKKTAWEKRYQSSTGNYCHVTAEFEGKIGEAWVWIQSVYVYICCKFKYIHFPGSVNEIHCIRNKNKTVAIVRLTWLYAQVRDIRQTRKDEKSRLWYGSFLCGSMNCGFVCSNLTNVNVTRMCYLQHSPHTKSA